MRMRKKKHGAERIAACAEYLISDVAPLSTLGSNQTAIFPAVRPLHMEIGCGKGNFAVGMAAANPDVNFIAVEKISDVACCALEKAKATAVDRPGDNLRFLIGDAQFLADWVEPHSVSRIYLNFSDPWPKKGYAKRRLTHRNFLALYRNVLVEGGELYLKTDNEGLFDFSMEEFEAVGLTVLFSSRDFHKTPEAEGNIMTEYEANFSSQGMPIYCARVQFGEGYRGDCVAEHIDAHRLCRQNRGLLESGNRCGCFHCLSVFDPKEIDRWTDHGETAFCPRCGIDAVLPETEEYPLSPEFLQKMHDYWFGETVKETIVSKSKVYFSPVITPEKVLEMYERLGVTLPGNVAIKVHSGEKGNQNFIRPDFWKPVIEKVGGTVVECNTAYEGARNTTERHMSLFRDHGWTDYYKVDLLDAEGPDLVLPIPNGKVIKENYVGKDIANYDSMLVLSHFKGHPMGGFGGALKQLSIGCASSFGKAYIHGAGVPEDIWTADHDSFLESMADAAASVVDLFKGQIVYVNVMKNMSVDCDCCAVAEDPCIADIGILVSTDPIAIDQACVDLVYACSDPGKPHLIERIESRNGIHTVEAASELGFGSREYELITI